MASVASSVVANGVGGGCCRGQRRRKWLGLSVMAVTSSDGSGTWMSSSLTKITLKYSPGASRPPIEVSVKSYASTEENIDGKGVSEPVGPLQEHVVTQQKKAAKIHDFCLGIPFGGLVLSGGIAGFIFTRNSTTLSTGVLFGGALLALSTFSLKVWRQGKSSLPFILGQAAITRRWKFPKLMMEKAVNETYGGIFSFLCLFSFVLATALLWKNFQTYSTTLKLFPTGFYAFISAAMLGFYFYVVMSGGNPPPKKLRSSVVAHQNENLLQVRSDFEI